MIAALALYHLMADPDEADPWAVCAAASDRQADLVFNAAKLMCELSPALREATDRYRWEIRPKGRPGRLERVAASAGKLDGKNISFLVVDELHEWNLENWAILTNGTVAGAGRRSSRSPPPATTWRPSAAVSTRRVSASSRAKRRTRAISSAGSRRLPAPTTARRRRGRRRTRPMACS
jgi:phage terminase large subunit-like protein